MGTTNTTQTNAGIYGIGIYMPETVRRNDWWPADVVAKWHDRPLHKIEKLPVASTAGVETALEAINEIRHDFFAGAVERRAMRPDELSSEMETKAALRAFENANVDPSEIDMVISYTMCPDYLAGPTGGVVHKNLGLPKRCMTLSIDNACNAFATQMALADQAIRSGSAKRVLLLTSAAFSKFLRQETSWGVWMGDGAAATIVGPVSSGRGVLSSAHATEGEGYRGMVFGVPGKRWHEEGKVCVYLEDKPGAQAIVLGVPDRCKAIISEALGGIDLAPKDVNFYACHQAGPWIRRVTQEFTGMHNAKYFDTFKAFGNVGAVNIPLMLSMASKEGVLRDDDVIATFSAGTGLVYSSVVMRWGR